MWKSTGYHLQITGWEGRLGNNLQQLCCATFIAEKTQSKVTYPAHKLLPNKTISFLKDTNTTIPKHKIIRNTFFQYSTSCGELLPLYNNSEQRRIFETYIRDLFSEYLEKPKTLELRSSDLIIHLRSGDIYNVKPHKLYVQDPFSYYKVILDEVFQEMLNNGEKEKRIIILTEEDRRSPCMSLIESYIQKLNLDFTIERIGESVNSPLTYIACTDLTECIQTLLTAENIVMANSSFSQRLCMCNNKVKNIWVSNLSIAEKAEKHPKINVHFHRIKNYIKHGEWANLPKQRKLMEIHSTKDIEMVPIEQANLPAHFCKTAL